MIVTRGFLGHVTVSRRAVTCPLPITMRRDFFVFIEI